MATVLITSEYFGRYSNEGRKVLEAYGHDIRDNPYGHKLLAEEEIIAHCAPAEAIICDLEPITRAVIDAAPRLRVIARRGVGVDSVDMAYAEKRGVRVCRTPGLVEAPVAELVMGYMLELSRHLCRHSREMHAARWGRCESASLEGKTLGLLGMGKISSAVAHRARTFGMRMVYADPVRNKDAEERLGVKQLPLEDMLAECDFLSLHVPLNEYTCGMIDRRRIALMKPGACILNTSRGGVIRVEELAAALRAGHIAGAAIDVYDHEPCLDSPLQGLDNVILTPHIGTFTRETYIGMDVAAAVNVNRAFA